LVKFGIFFAENRKRLRLIGENVPFVDIIITTCKEDIGVVQDTILAALAIDYPKDKYRVVLSDDGACQELRSWVLELDQPRLFYTNRTSRGGFKAGNLNHAVEFLESLPGGVATFIAALDADMIVEKHWLRSVAAHIVLDRSIALVCPSQVSPTPSFASPKLALDRCRGLYFFAEETHPPPAFLQRPCQ
jgi:cellulose synthase/poly-beta-1,6-N-acetylglucosamine synthase-like glycosyltransferase